MGLFDKIRGELIDVIEWTDDSRDTIVWRFPRHNNEIKMGAKLTVRESQTAVFVNEGQVADIFPPGMFELYTQNMPILSTLKGWRHGFESPFKAEVYFVNTRRFTDMKWGTQNPVMMRDPEFGMVRLRAFGAYAMQVTDPARMLRELAGTDPQFRTDEVSDYLRKIIVGKLGPALAKAEVPALDLAANQQDIGAKLATALTEELADIGLSIPRFIIENISLPPEVEAAMDKRTQMGIVGDLDQYTKFQTANAVQDAANNPGGAGEGLGMGVGLAAGHQMMSNMNAAQQQQQQQPRQQPQAAPAPHQQAGPPPLPQPDQWFLGVNGQQQGPFDPAALAAQISSGVLTRQTLAWKEGMQQWTPAGELPELASLFSSTPPPLPPPG